MSKKVELYESIDILAKELQNRGFRYEKVVLAGKKHYRFFKNNTLVWMTQTNPVISYPLTTHTIQSVAKIKTISYEVAEKIHVNTPKTTTINNLDEIAPALNILQECKTVVAKPETGSLSAGLSLDITNVTTLKKALSKISALKDNAIVQEQVSGDEIRIAVLNGQYAGSILRQTPKVIGDGISTIAELIAAENIARSKIKKVAVDYPALNSSMINGAYLTDQSVPEPGEIIELGKGTMIMNGASVYNVSDSLHHSYREVAERLARYMGAGFIVVDIMVKDLRKAATKHNYWLIELNSSPVLRMFYSCRDGNHFDIAPALAQTIDQALSAARPIN